MSPRQTALNGRPGAVEASWREKVGQCRSNVQVSPLQTALNERPGAVDKCEGCKWVRLGKRIVAPRQTALNGRPGAMTVRGGSGVGEVGGRVQKFPLQTALNGRPGAIGVGEVKITRCWQKSTHFST